jgi:surface antigen
MRLLDANGGAMSSERDLESFIHDYLAVPNVGTNSVNRGQCTGLVALWCVWNDKSIVYANAVDILKEAPRNSYHVEYNSPINYPHSGNIVCWDGAYGNGYGHTAVVVAANENELVVFEQNNPYGHAPIVSTHDYNHVQGWLWWE